MPSPAPRPVTGNAATVSKDTRGWFLGHFMPGADNPLRNGDLEVKWLESLVLTVRWPSIPVAPGA